MNNNTTLYDGMSDEDTLIKDILVWEGDIDLGNIGSYKEIMLSYIKLNEEARKLLTRAKELL